MTKRKRAKRKRKRKPKRQSLLGEPMELVKLGITTTATLGMYSITLEALSKMKR